MKHLHVRLASVATPKGEWLLDNRLETEMGVGIAHAVFGVFLTELET